MQLIIVEEVCATALEHGEGMGNTGAGGLVGHLARHAGTSCGWQVANWTEKREVDTRRLDLGGVSLLLAMLTLAVDKKLWAGCAAIYSSPALTAEVAG